MPYGHRPCSISSSNHYWRRCPKYQASRPRYRVSIPRGQISHAADQPGVSRGGSHGRNVNLRIPDAGVRIVVLSPPAKDDHCLARFHRRKTFPDSSYDRPFGNRPSRGCALCRQSLSAPAPPDRSSFCLPACLRQARPASPWTPQTGQRIEPGHHGEVEVCKTLRRPCPLQPPQTGPARIYAIGGIANSDTGRRRVSPESRPPSKCSSSSGRSIDLPFGSKILLNIKGLV